MYRKWEDPLERKEREREREEKHAVREAGGEKKTFRERDAIREGKGPREVVMNRSGGSGRPVESSSQYRAYKSNLDRMFDGKLKMPGASSPIVSSSSLRTNTPAGGGMHVSSASPTTGFASSPAPAVVPQTPKESLRFAETDDAILDATQQCLDNGGIPMDADLIAKALTLKHERYLVPVMEALLDFMERGRPKNAKLLIQRIVEAHDFLVAAHALDLAKGLRVRLGDSTISI